jgi:hypothetical protein
VSGNQEVTYTLELGGGGQRRRHESQTPEADRQPREAKTADQPIPRIATQIMKLLHLAPDIQEQILFLPVIEGFNERNLRPIVRLIDWDEQRTLFRKMMARWMK